MQNAHMQKYTVYVIRCNKNFVHFIFVGGATHEKFLTTKISQSMVLHYSHSHQQEESEHEDGEVDKKQTQGGGTATTQHKTTSRECCLSMFNVLYQ